MTQEQLQLLELLKQELEEHFGQVTMAEQEGITFLRLAPALYEDGVGLVYMEICLISHSPAITIVQVYSTMIPQPGPGLAALREQLGAWNHSSVAGSYGIYEKLGQLYHKHNIALLNDGAIADQTDLVFAGICTAMDEMSRHLVEAVNINSSQE